MKPYHRRALTFLCVLTCLCSGYAFAMSRPPAPDPELKRLNSKVEELTSENSNLLKENTTLKRENEDMRANKVPLKRKMFLLGMGAVMAILIMGIAFLVFRSKSDELALTTMGHQESNCPRCGWRIADGDTACSNPECRTRIN